MSNRSYPTLLMISFLVLIDWGTKLAVILQKKSNFVCYPLLCEYSWGKFFIWISPFYNEGAAFGLFSQYKVSLFAMRAAIIIVLLGYLLLKKKISPALRCALILLCSGAIGNLGDTLFYRHVVDFISIGYKEWLSPVFNFADIFISLGTLIFIVELFVLLNKRKNKDNSSVL
ncbi:Lipoprotein signal peptidase [Chlamydia avium]|uniref:Lipoprotein signal peptidase n=1 Tax=Chlamydia avium TaxID=1457141 RepID=A0ABP2X834_9CHLA|nr:signal peptidase II [Chlamydia avium]EPP37768.1 signal peptidase II [Chlamydia psittaci 10_743_SC13]EPP38802.1 signal peptidase II [Chlamydia avium]VVT42533.1 Lipoprotein signal peptidase [Chlamydia avium]